MSEALFKAAVLQMVGRHFTSIETVRNGSDVDYISCCQCGFESLPFANRHEAMQAVCEVLAAEVEGARRRAKRRQLAKSA